MIDKLRSLMRKTSEPYTQRQLKGDGVCGLIGDDGTQCNIDTQITIGVTDSSGEAAVTPVSVCKSHLEEVQEADFMRIKWIERTPSDN